MVFLINEKHSYCNASAIKSNNVYCEGRTDTGSASSTNSEDEVYGCYFKQVMIVILKAWMTKQNHFIGSIYYIIILAALK